MANVVICLGDANFKAGLTGNAEFLSSFGTQPLGTALEFVFARSAHALHDFWHAGVEGEGRGENHAHRLFGAVSQGDVVADTFTVKVDVGLGGDGDVVDFFGGHAGIKGKVSRPLGGGVEGWHKPKILGHAGHAFNASGDNVVLRPCRN